MSDSSENKAKIVGTLGLLLIFAIAFPSCYALRGRGGYGSTSFVTATVKTKHVDSGGKNADSSYMVTTDKGTFEVDNGILLGIWNSDEIYGYLEVGHTYQFWIRGSESKNMFWQQYPYITRATKVQK